MPAWIDRARKIEFSIETQDNASCVLLKAGQELTNIGWIHGRAWTCTYCGSVNFENKCDECGAHR